MLTVRRPCAYQWLSLTSISMTSLRGIRTDGTRGASGRTSTWSGAMPSAARMARGPCKTSTGMPVTGIEAAPLSAPTVDPPGRPEPAGATVPITLPSAVTVEAHLLEPWEHDDILVQGTPVPPQGARAC